MKSVARPSLLLRITALVLVCLLPVSCIGLMPSPYRPSPGPKKSPQIKDLAEAFDVVCRSYRLGPDDVLSLLIQVQWRTEEGNFRLETLDEIAIKFILDPQLNEDVVIRPDGMITLQAIGDIRAVGYTPEELARRIEKKFIDANIFTRDDARGELQNYKLVTVHVKKFYQKTQRLVEGLTTLTGGQQSTLTVNPDGTIDFPGLSERVLATGHTVMEVEKTANRLYRSGEYKHALASLALQQAKSRKVYVMGEVRSPGAYDIRQPITALHAIALAGGHQTDTADLTSVILISKNVHGKPIGRRLDLKRILDVGDMSAAILVKPYDVLYVPKTYVRDVRLFMEQYIATVRDFTQLVNLIDRNDVN